MAMGAWRISRAHVLTRRASAIETLGAATVLCTDKTGTLTLNRMSIAELRLKGSSVHAIRDAGAPSPAFAELLRIGILASAPQPFDPMEKAFHELGARWHVETMEGAALERIYGLSRELLIVTHVWRDGKGLLVASKGAPEAIARLCRLGIEELTEIKATVDTMATEGLRVLGVARARFEGETLPDDPRVFVFSFLGLVGLADPLRESVLGAVADCGSAGIRVVMITGDYPATARAIAKQAGLESSQLMTGEELNACTEDDLTHRVRDVTVFARTMPDQKLRIVKALKACGEIVAMTGDGVNDAPSLKAAHIGIAMGERGTDVAREASSIVLLNDDFGSVVEAVRLGRRIYDNLRKAMGFIFAVHLPIAGLALLPLVSGLPIIFSPIHIAFLEMVIDPVCTLVFEAEIEEEDIMRRPPRAPDEPLFSGRLIWWSILQGVVAFAVVGAIYAVAYRQGMPANEVRALTFFSLVTAIVALIFVNRSFSASIAATLRRSNRALKIVLLGVVGILTLTLTWPVAAHLFRFGPLHANDLALTLATGVTVLLILEILKSRWVVRS
jgi:Ca2+-transporting ATPase